MCRLISQSPNHINPFLLVCLLCAALLSGCTLIHAGERPLSAREVVSAAPAAVPETLPPVRPTPAPAASPAYPEARPVVSQGDYSYENATITEDVVWSGTVLVRGYLVIAPQATVRVEAGTVVRFMTSALSRQAPRLVVMGRLHCDGAPGRPVLFAPNSVRHQRGEWGGILLLSSEKRNQLDHLRIEGAGTGIEAGFSTFSATDLSVSRCTVGLLLRDSGASLTRSSVSDCETGLDVRDSELDLREGSVNNNQRGMVVRGGSLVLHGVTLAENRQGGLTALDCRIAVSSCRLIANGTAGARLEGSEGRISGSRFTANRGVGLDLVSSRLRVRGCLFSGTAGDGMRVDDGRCLVWDSAFENNSGYNLAVSGHDRVTAVGNWWGSGQESSIAGKLLDGATDRRRGSVEFFPWLTMRPDDPT